MSNGWSLCVLRNAVEGSPRAHLGFYVSHLPLRHQGMSHQVFICSTPRLMAMPWSTTVPSQLPHKSPAKCDHVEWEAASPPRPGCAMDCPIPGLWRTPSWGHVGHNIGVTWAVHISKVGLWSITRGPLVVIITWLNELGTGAGSNGSLSIQSS